MYFLYSRRALSLLALAVVFCVACLAVGAVAPLPGVLADDGDGSRNGFDFGGPEGGTKKPTPADRRAPGSAPRYPEDPISREIALLAGWPDRKATHAAEALFLRQQEAIPQLVHTLDRGDPKLQAGAAWVLGQVGEEVHVQVILRAAAKRQNASRANVFFNAAYGIGPKATKRWLISFLTVANRPVFRVKAAEFLVNKIDAEDQARVLNLLNSDKAAVRIAGLKLLAPSRVEDVNERLLHALSDLAASVSYEAARQLAARADGTLIVRLNAFARDAGARERAYAIITLVEIARAQSSNPFEEATVADMSGRRGLLHPERLCRGAAATGLAYGALDSRDPTLTALIDGRVVDMLINTLGGAHFRDFASVKPGIFASLRRLTGQDLADTAVAWAQWWQSNRENFRARRPLHGLSGADVIQAYIKFDAIESSGRRMHATFIPEGGVERAGAFILHLRVFEGLVAFLEGEGIFDLVERGGVRASEHVAVTVGVLNQRKRMVVTANILGGTEVENEANRLKFKRLTMRMDALLEANEWQKYRDADKWPDSLSWWKTNVDLMAQASPGERKALLQSAIVFAFDDLSGSVVRARALLRLQSLGTRLTKTEARQLATVLSEASSFGRIESEGLRWVIEQGHDDVREEIADAVSRRSETEAREILAGLLLAGGTERLRSAFADERTSMRAAAAHGARLFVESGGASNLPETERDRVFGRLRPGLEVLSLDDDPSVSILSLIALAYIGDTTVIAKLEDLYKSGNFSVKLEVTRSLGYIPGRSPHRFLTRVMAEERKEGNSGALRAAALESMARTDHKDAVRLLRYYLLNDRDANVRKAAGRILADMGTDEARFSIVEQLTGGEPDPVRRAALVDVLGRFQGDIVPPLLRKYLADRDQRVRTAAALRAADHNLAEAFPFLLQILRRGTGSERDRALIAVENLTSVRFGIRGYSAAAERYELWFEDARIKGGTDRSWFREALRRKGYDVGPLAAYLKEEEGLAALPLLTRALRDEDVVIRRNAAVALERLARRSFGKVDRGTSPREAATIADQWADWYQERNEKR